jgi:ComF family protein
MLLKKLISFYLDMLFPKHCLGCQKYGTYLCEDCKSCFVEISQYQYCLCKKPILLINNCPKCKNKKLDALYFATSYQKSFVKKLIYYFKYEPFIIKELSHSLSYLIIEHFYLLENPPCFLTDKTNFILIPIPLHINKLKKRGFNQAEELAKELSKYLNIPLISDFLIKNKETLPQTELDNEARKENIKGVFLVKDNKKIDEKNILLIDDVYTTGSTMEEAAKVLKRAGAEKVIGIVIARG